MLETADSLEAPPALVEPGEGEPVLAEVVEPAVVEAPQSAEPSSLAAEQRREWAQRIRGEQRLPGALRERLAAVVAESALVASDAEPQLTISQVATVFAETLPTLLSLETPRSVARHPGGEAFFRAGQLSDDDAARIAREQLARTGFAS